MHVFQSDIYIVRKREHWIENKTVKGVNIALIWVITTLPDCFSLNSSCRSRCKCDVKICPAGVLAATRWTSVVTAKGRGYGQYQVPHQHCDWNHKTEIDWTRPWPALTLLARASQNRSPGVPSRPPRRADPTGTFSSSLTETRPYFSGHPPVTHFSRTLHISPPVWPNFPMSHMF